MLLFIDKIRALQVVVPPPVGTLGVYLDPDRKDGPKLELDGWGDRLLAAQWEDPQSLPILYTLKPQRGTDDTPFDEWLPNPESQAWRGAMLDWLQERGEVRVSAKGAVIRLYDGRKVQAEAVGPFALALLVLAVCGEYMPWTRVRRGGRLRD